MLYLRRVDVLIHLMTLRVATTLKYLQSVRNLTIFYHQLSPYLKHKELIIIIIIIIKSHLILRRILIKSSRAHKLSNAYTLADRTRCGFYRTQSMGDTSVLHVI